ncbi:MAG: hypothetical protein JO316_08910 [Abitibacteriaceae bacterium]|nr:hypothetical protein [Abditibacteriaceae bacterium]
MITTIADLLEEFRLKETEVLNAQNVVHGPTIGSMYEGLTKHVLRKSIFEGMDLRVTSGFIEDSEGHLSDQMDCLLVRGPGKIIPYTDNHVYQVSNVIAVVEVKKNLYSKDLIEADQNIYSVNNIRDYSAFHFESFERQYELIVQETLPARDKVTSLPLWKHLLYASLLVENILPVRIVLGYHGFTTEKKFRESFVGYLKNNLNTYGFGPTRFPNLIVCNKYSLIKLNGLPYASPLQHDNYWNMYGSYSGNPMVLVLELIWSRLAYKHGLPVSVFGEDMKLEVIKPLIKAKGINHNGQNGWDYGYIDLTKQELASVSETDNWEPAFLTEAQAAIYADLLRANLPYDNEAINDKFLAKYGLPVEQVVEELRRLGLAAVDNGEIVPLTKRGKLALLRDKQQWVAGEDSNGRFQNWVNNYLEQNTDQSSDVS